MIPMGKSHRGLRHSSEAVNTASKPMNAKKTTAAPAHTPGQRLGMKGCKFSGFTYIEPTMTKNASTNQLDGNHHGIESGTFLDANHQDRL